MGQLSLLFGFSRNLGLGLTPDEKESIYSSLYMPLIQSVYQFPEIRCTDFYSGATLAWLESDHAEYLSVLSDMSKAKKLELLTGSYSNSILSTIPRSDRIGQIERLTTYLRKLFGRRSRGGWISEQVWEQDYVAPLRIAGLDYVFLDDYHFYKAGFEKRSLGWPTITEDQGKALTIVPVMSHMTQDLLELAPQEFANSILEEGYQREGHLIATIFPLDLYQTRAKSLGATGVKEWFDGLFEAFRQHHLNRDLVVVNAYRYLKNNVGTGRSYFPPTVVRELWEHRGLAIQKLPNDEEKRLLPGIKGTGYYDHVFFRQLLTRYPEASFLYGKMHYVHSLVNQVRGDKYRKQAAREDLWDGEANEAYWHGPNGGIYRNGFRKQAYRSLILAEKATRERGIFMPSILAFDVDMDGQDEYLYQGNDYNAYMHLRGGMVFELDHFGSSWNYLDTMGRYPESYHDEAAEAFGYDVYPRKGWVDHLFTPKTSIEDFQLARWEDGSDLSRTRYEVLDYRRDSNVFKLGAECSYHEEGKSPLSFYLRKEYVFSNQNIEVTYTFINLEDEPREVTFGSQLNLSFKSSEVEDLRLYPRQGRNRLPDINPQKALVLPPNDLVFEDLTNKLNLQLSFSDPGEVWSLPLYTCYEQDGQLIQGYQASTVIPRWNFVLQPMEECSCSFSLKFVRKKG